MIHRHDWVYRESSLGSPPDRRTCRKCGLEQEYLDGWTRCIPYPGDQFGLW